ncbi:MAG: esterase [Lachnospiraceae bacterium]|nr:esterase [Lachnospiraceae bacterium]
MAKLTVKYFSECLVRPVTFEMYLPNDVRTNVPWAQGDDPYRKRPIKTLFLLHGYTGSADNYVPEYLSEQYNFAVIAPNGENGFWLDGISTGHKFCTLLGEEIPGYVRKTFGLAKSAEDTYILGLSMGGFGALHTGLAYPGQFGKIGAMSSALIVHEVAGMKDGQGNAVANYEYYRECFGQPDQVLKSDNNPETLVDRLLSEKKKIPEIYMCCGTEDFLLENNREFHRFLVSRGVSHEYFESKGTHDMQFWSEYTEKIVKWMFA